jgi:hypothetical protein
MKAGFYKEGRCPEGYCPICFPVHNMPGVVVTFKESGYPKTKVLEEGVDYEVEELSNENTLGRVTLTDVSLFAFTPDDAYGYLVVATEGEVKDGVEGIVAVTYKGNTIAQVGKIGKAFVLQSADTTC